MTEANGGILRTRTGNSRPTVLVVDDEALIRWSVGESLRRAGYSVMEAEDGSNALQHFGPGQHDVKLVLLDLKLPDTDGLTILREIKRTDAECRVIVMTAYGTPETADTAIQQGAYGLIHKPFNVEDIVSLVGMALDT